MKKTRPNSARARVLGGIGIAGVTVASFWLRLPGFTQGGIANHDVAGILYEGMLLAAGGLPYVDTVEMKAPGSFYLAWWLASGGTHVAAFQVWANAFALASLVVLASIAWRLFGPAAAVAAAALYALHDAMLDTMDANYVTWAQLPMVLSAAWALSAVATRPERAWPFAIAGALAGTAALVKHPAGVVAIPLCVLVAVLPRTLDDATSPRAPGVRRRAAAATLVGLAASQLPIVLHYAVHGQLQALVLGYFASERGLAYALDGTRRLAADAWREGPLATIHVLALPLALAAFAGFPPARPRERVLVLVLLGWIVLALLAASIGFRFYKGYFLGVLPPLCLLAAAPWGLLGHARGLSLRTRVLVLVPLVLLVARQGRIVHDGRLNRAQVHDAGGRTVAAFVRKHSPPGARVWVWGWHLWDVYPYTGMLSGARVFKSLSLLTTPNDATWRRPRSRPRFVDGPMASMVLEDLARTRPHYIVLGGSVPHREWKALQAFLRREYEHDRRLRLGRVECWRLRDERSVAKPIPSP